MCFELDTGCFSKKEIDKIRNCFENDIPIEKSFISYDLNKVILTFDDKKFILTPSSKKFVLTVQMDVFSFDICMTSITDIQNFLEILLEVEKRILSDKDLPQYIH